MTIQKAVPIFSTVCILAAQAGTMMETSPSRQSEPSGGFQPDIDFLRTAYSQTGDMDIDGEDGDMSMSRFELRAILSEPISPLDGLSIIPVFSYSASALDFSGTDGAFPIEDEDLHSIALSAFFIQDIRNSPWFAVGWTRAEMATDFQAISGDDFDFDLAGGMGYRFSDNFTLGFGVAVLSLNGDTTIFPGISFDWVPMDKVRVGLYGPNFIASYKPDENWDFSVRGEPGGGEWNIRDAAGDSRTIDMTSYRLGLHASRRIAGEFWLGAGVGYTFANEIELRSQHGGNSYDRDLDGSLFGQVTLSLHRW